MAGVKLTTIIASDANNNQQVAIELELEGQEIKLVFMPEAAVQLGLQLIEAGHSAQYDGALLDFMVTGAGTFQERGMINAEQAKAFVAALHKDVANAKADSSIVKLFPS